MIRMILINSIYFFLIFHTQSIWTYQCLKCTTKVYDHPITIQDLLYPTDDDCNIVMAIHGCYIRIDWLVDGTTEVYYETDSDLPYDSIFAVIERQLNLVTNKYSTQTSIGYSCRSNTTACNTIDSLKHIMISIKFPTDKQIQQFDNLVTPTKTSNHSTCSHSSITNNCHKSDIIDCQQCMNSFKSIADSEICSTCSTAKVTRNFFVYQTTILLNKVSRLERLIMGCQQHDICYLMKNMKQIKRMLKVKLDLQKFYRSTASTTKSSVLLLVIIVFRLIKQ